LVENAGADGLDLFQLGDLVEATVEGSLDLSHLADFLEDGTVMDVD